MFDAYLQAAQEQDGSTNTIDGTEKQQRLVSKSTLLSTHYILMPVRAGIDVLMHSLMKLQSCY